MSHHLPETSSMIVMGVAQYLVGAGIYHISEVVALKLFVEIFPEKSTGQEVRLPPNLKQLPTLQCSDCIPTIYI